MNGIESFWSPTLGETMYYSKVYPLLTLELLRIGTIFFKSTVENLSRDYTIMGLSL